METEFGNRTTFSAKTYLRKVKKNLWGDFVKTLGVKKGGIFKKNPGTFMDLNLPCHNGLVTKLSGINS